MTLLKDHPFFRDKGILPLRVQMLTGKFRKVIIRHKGIFEKAIKTYASTIPEPTKGNCLEELTYQLIDARESFFLENPDVPKREMVEAAWKILIEEVESNDEYRPAWKGLIKVLREIEDADIES